MSEKDGSIQLFRASADPAGQPDPPLDVQQWAARAVGHYRLFLDLASENDWKEYRLHRFLERHALLVPGAGGAPGRGHHGVRALNYLFTEPRIEGVDARYGPDFMWVRTDSSAVYACLVEIERPSKQWFNPSNGVQSADLSQALNQIHDWKNALEASAARDILVKRYKLGKLIDNGVRQNRLKFEYYLAFGRESEFYPEAASPHGSSGDRLNRKRESLAVGARLMLLDSLSTVDAAGDAITVKSSIAGELNVVAVQPTFATGPRIAPYLHRLTGLESAIQDMAQPIADLPDSVPAYISQARADYLVERVSYWKNAYAEAMKVDGIWSAVSEDCE